MGTGWAYDMTDTDAANAFITRWKESGGNELANFQSFASELTDLIGVEKPKPATTDGQNNHYRFERPVKFIHTGRQRRGRVDLYRKGCFVMEGKQGADGIENTDERQLALLTDQETPQIKQAGHGRRGTRAFDDAMIKARSQADGYARAVSREDGWPPFLMIVDVGHVIELYADFSRQGQGYTPFPDGKGHKIHLDELADPYTRALLATIWTDPDALNPALKTASVTREIAKHLAELGKSLEKDGHAGETVARFLMRSLFTMFAEDVGLIETNSFTELLKDLRGHPRDAEPALNALWTDMDKGGFSSALRARVRRFNGGLFREADALPLSPIQLGLLIEAAEADWSTVEPAIFGTLLERALDPKQRHKLGAHYTPRAYVERLVIPVVIEPLRNDWRDVQAAALTLANENKLDAAREIVRAFHKQLCKLRVLDPACGSGNFLYVAMELMKKLEGEVTQLQKELGDNQALLGLEALTVSPEQFLGLELNVWAKEVAELVLWIGYLQWQYRTFGKANEEDPVLRDFHNIEHADALLVLEGERPRIGEDGQPESRWDGETYMTHPATGERVPDPLARRAILDFDKARPREWPAADFIVGNPPFIGASRMRDALGDGYVETLWDIYPKMPESADFVMFWWHKAATIAQGGGVRRFGFITTNSLRQTFARRVLEPFLDHRTKPLSLLFAIPDHPWVDGGDGAAVRIAMTVAAPGKREGRLLTVTHEDKEEREAQGRRVTLSETTGVIFPNLQTGVNVAAAVPLRANSGLATRGVMLFGQGFAVTPEKAKQLGLGRIAGIGKHIRRYQKGRELQGRPKALYVLDMLGLTPEKIASQYPEAYAHLIEHVKSERESNNRKSRREKWWLFGEALAPFRPALKTVSHYIATVETSKHRIFSRLDSEILPDNKLVVFAVEDFAALAIVSSVTHIKWSLAAGGWLGEGNDPVYVKSKCFDPFPFPDCTPEQTALLRRLGEQLDVHRKARQAEHPKLTLTNMYNVLERYRGIEAARSGEVLEGKDKQIWQAGQIGTLKAIHDEIDAAVAAAYGWPANLSDEDILKNLLALNRERALEEATGEVRWLRPDFQNPTGADIAAKTKDADLAGEAKPNKALPAWPKTLPERIAAVRTALEDMGEASPKQIGALYRGAGEAKVTPLLESLAALGQAEVLEDGRYAA